MAKKSSKIEDTAVAEETVVEDTVAEETVVEDTVVELTTEEQAIVDALAADDHIEALTSLRDGDVPSATLKTVISTFLALVNALGADAPATQHALANLQNFKSAKVKAPKATKKPKEPKFNEAALLKAELEAETPDFQSLLDNEKVSEAMKIAITTYTTLAGLDGVDEAVVDTAKMALVNFGKKGGKRASSGPVEEFNVEYKDVAYKNLAAAIYAAGYTTDINSKKQRLCDVAWRAVRSKLLKIAIGEVVDHEGHAYTKIAPTANAIGGTRGRQKQEESTAEVVDQAEESYE